MTQEPPTNPFFLQSYITEGLVAAKCAVMTEAGYVQKEGTVSGFGAGYKFAGERHILAKVAPAMAKHGLSLAPIHSEIIDTGEVTVGKTGNVWKWLRTRVYYRLSHTSGGWEIVCAIGEGQDAADKGAPKSNTIAFKYAIRQAFCIETGDDPDESNDPSEPYTANPDMAQPKKERTPPPREQAPPPPKQPKTTPPPREKPPMPPEQRLKTAQEKAAWAMSEKDLHGYEALGAKLHTDGVFNDQQVAQLRTTIKNRRGLLTVKAPKFVERWDAAYRCKTVEDLMGLARKVKADDVLSKDDRNELEQLIDRLIGEMRAPKV